MKTSTIPARAALCVACLAIAACSLGPVDPPPNEYQYARQYVSVTGSDSNDGLSPAAALRSIDLAVSRCADYGAEILVGAGTYSTDSGISPGRDVAVDLRGKTNITLSGGWDEGFSSVTGRSRIEGPSQEEIDADSSLRMRLVKINGGCSGIAVSGFVLARGYATGEGAGLLLEGSNCSVSDTAIEDCRALSTLFTASRGGGACIGGTGNDIELTVSGCQAHSGGGLCIKGSGHTIDGEVSGCSANKGGGAYIDPGASDIIVDCQVSGNKAVDGGGIYAAGRNCRLRGPVSGNSATGIGVIGDIAASVRGGGVFLAGEGNIVSGEVTANDATFAAASIISLAPRAYGGGIYATGTGHSISGNIDDNDVSLATLSLISIGSGVFGGGVYATATGISISGSVSGNSMTILGSLSYSAGAGIYLYEAHGASITGNVSGNLTETVNLAHESHGHGVFVSASNDVHFSGAHIGGNGFSGILGGHRQIEIDASAEGPCTGLVIENCSIRGGPEAPYGYAIRERSAETSVDVAGHAILNTSFGDLEFLYFDYDGIAVNADAGGLATLNTPEDPAHDAAIAEGNSLM